ncbi:hypothetical protein GCM10027167_41440 [Nocardia heshunensis]
MIWDGDRQDTFRGDSSVDLYNAEMVTRVVVDSIRRSSDQVATTDRLGASVTESGIPPLLTVSQSRVGETIVVSATGEIDINSAGQLREALEAAVPTAPRLIIDLSGVDFIGSVGLTTLLVATDTADSQQVRVVASPQVRRPIEMTGLDNVLALFDTLEDAISQPPK